MRRLSCRSRTAAVVGWCRADEAAELLATWVERGGVDFVQVNYSMYSRDAERQLFRVAAERGAAVITNMPFETARLLKRVQGRELPPFAREISVSSWAQYSLKWVISHPAVTCALPATSNPEHRRDNMEAMHGELPDAPWRDRMLAHVSRWSGFSEIGAQPWYPDKSYRGLIGRAQSQLRARK